MEADASAPDPRDLEIGRRIAEACEGLTKVEIGAIAGCSVQTARRMIDDGKGLEAARLLRIAEARGVSLSWLMTGVGAMWPGQHQSQSQSQGDDAEMVPIPIIAVPASAGPGATLDDDAAEERGSIAFPRAWARELGTLSRLRMIEIIGDSMQPDLDPGDWMVVNLDMVDIRDGIALVRLDDALLVKRLQPQGRTLLLTSSNAAYHPISIDLKADADRFAVLGRARWRTKILP